MGLLRHVLAWGAWKFVGATRGYRYYENERTKKRTFRFDRYSGRPLELNEAWLAGKVDDITVFPPSEAELRRRAAVLAWAKEDERRSNERVAGIVVDTPWPLPYSLREPSETPWRGAAEAPVSIGMRQDDGGFRTGGGMRSEESGFSPGGGMSDSSSSSSSSSADGGGGGGD